MHRALVRSSRSVPHLGLLAALAAAFVACDDGTSDPGGEAGADDGSSDGVSDAGDDGSSDGVSDIEAEAEVVNPFAEGVGRDGLLRWNILGPGYVGTDANDFMSFEWDYFMIHSEDGRFTGSVGYLVANPRNSGAGGLGDMVPKGGNAAIAGRFEDGAVACDYLNYGLEGFSASGTERSFQAGDPDDVFATMTALRGTAGTPDRLALAGRTTNFSWQLEIAQDWPGLSAGAETFAPMHGSDVGTLGMFDEEWNVNMLWPRTRVTGTITRLATGETLAVNGHGYRENSWGRWAFNLGGWDFAVVSDAAAMVSFTWQTYHPVSTELDYVDVGFVDGGEPRLVQFRATRGEIGWVHDHWAYHAEARQCMPQDTRVVAQNDEWRVEATIDLVHRMAPMLSDATAATAAYVIMIQFPYVEGTITERRTGRVVATFGGQGGGEFAAPRRGEGEPVPTAADCAAFGASYRSPLPE